MSETETSWSPRWYLWEGGFLALGRTPAGGIPPHSHHAIQVTIARSGPVRVAGADGVWHDAAGFIVRPDVRHSYDSCGRDGAMIFVEPESFEGRWLQAALASDITFIPGARLAPCAAELTALVERPLEAMDVGDVVRHCVRALSPGAPPSRRLDPRIVEVLAAIRGADDLRISLEDVAARVFLSPSRLAHVFAEHVGLPFRRYLLWRKLTRAMLAVGRGTSLTEAAHAAGFADAAHFTRTFSRMFGIPPSVLLRGDFFEVPSPFTSEPR